MVIKKLYDNLGDDPALAQMFINEARLVCLLEHENIVKTHQVGVIDGQCCIVMEYLAGQPLQRLIRRTWTNIGISIELAVHICIHVLDALEYAHEVKDNRGRPLAIVHRDISPHSIFITNGGAVKVLDFAIAKAKTNECRTEVGSIKGKFAYLAPEQASDQSVDRRADIWSVGVILWEMLSGKRLFKAASAAATLRATLEADIPAMSALRAEISPELERIVRRALQRERRLRYQNATEMKQELRRYLVATRRRPDKSALAELMRTHFHDEILRQRRLAYELMAPVNQCATHAGDVAGTSEVDAEQNAVISAEVMQIGGLMRELTARQRTVVHALLISLFVFAAVAAFCIVILLGHLTRQNGHQAHDDSRPRSDASASPVEPSSRSGVTKLGIGARQTVRNNAEIDGNTASSPPSATPSAIPPGPETPQGALATPAASSATLPSVTSSKSARVKQQKIVNNYGI